jgi:hypothetical protein
MPSLPSRPAAASWLAVALGAFALLAPSSAEATTTVSWHAGAAIPRAHTEAAAAVIGRKLYVISGSPTDCTDGRVAAPTTAVDVYSTGRDRWKAGPSVNIGRDQQPIAATVHGRIFLIGGTSICGGSTVPQTEMLDKHTHTWTVLGSASNLPAPLDGHDHCGVALGTRIYDFQGAGIGVFDTGTLTWSVMPAPAALATSLFCDATRLPSGHVMITGPGNGSADGNSQRVIDYDPITNSAVVDAGVTAPMAEHVAGLLGDKVVVTGGDFAPLTSQAITLDGSSVTALPLAPDSRDDGVGAAIGGVLYVAGGVGSGGNTLPATLVAVPS